jgi:hypothetical protein
MHWLSLLLGLVFARVLLFFIGPKPRVSYYVQAPVFGLPISEIDSAMEAVGLASSDLKGAAGPSPAPAPAPVPEPSVADMALKQVAQAPAPSVPEAASPSPAPAAPL